MSDALLARVHGITGLGLNVTTFPSGHVEVRWRRHYGPGGLSDERFTEASSLTLALHKVIACEAMLDAEDVAA